MTPPPAATNAACLRGAEDHWDDDLRLLLGPEAGALVAAAAGAAGGALEQWSAKQVTHQPGSSTVVQYRAELRWPDRAPSTETIVAATGNRIPPGADVLDDGHRRVAIWRWPIDPALPGLPRALDRGRVGALLDDLGVDGGAVQLRVRAYRPGRRAVVEATGRRGRLFLKVVRPAKAQALHDTHRALAPHLPVPDSLGWTDDGIVVLPAVPGRTLRDALRSSDQELPPLAAIDALLDRLPEQLAGAPARGGPVDIAEHHAGVVAATVPGTADLVAEVLGRLRAADRHEHPVVPVHGDLYESQLLVREGRITGLLDVDTAGAGHRIDDHANLVAHLSVLGLVSDRPRPIKRYGAAVLAASEARFDRTDLRARVAAAVLGLTTGPFRVLEPHWQQATVRRLELALGWLDGAAPARARDERDLTHCS
jgi:hypothetical protein